MSDPALSDPWNPPGESRRKLTRHVVTGRVLRVFREDGSISMSHEEIPGLMAAMPAPGGMEFLVPDKESIERLQSGDVVRANVRRQGGDFVLENLEWLHPDADREQTP